MARRSQRLSDNRWCLWVDSRHRITFPKELMTKIGWQIGDTLVWTARDDGSFEVRSLNRDLRVRFVELDGLRESIWGTPEACRVEELASEIAELHERLFPSDRASSLTAKARQATAAAQTKATQHQETVSARIDAIFSSAVPGKRSTRS